MHTSLPVNHGRGGGAAGTGTWDQLARNPSGWNRSTSIKRKGISLSARIDQKRTEAEGILVLHSSSGARIRLPSRPAHRVLGIQAGEHRTSGLPDTSPTSCQVIAIADLAVIRLHLRPDNLGFKDTTEAQMASVVA